MIEKGAEEVQVSREGGMRLALVWQLQRRRR